MGVPSFFRWLAKKYPKVLVNVIEEYPKLVGDSEIPPDTSQPNPNGVEYDCLYLDMNGIIHPCAHPENKAQPKDEDEIMQAIFDYIDRLFNIVRPRRLLYMAIDGVAPRAKMNQQRSRRFRAARDAKEKAEIEADIKRELTENGLIDPNEAIEPSTHWDSNQITPGTPFMKRVAEALRYYVTDRITNDPGWANVMVVLSDSNVPGEGEHKLMEYIRFQHVQDGYNANTRHCVYGLDADLIMLSLATHEPHFSLLREDVLVNNDNRNPVQFAANAPKEEIYKHQPFQFLQINVLREYLEFDLRPEGTIPFEWDLERAIDDYVFLCFFVGNDFLPHLPTLEIREGAISTLMDLYKKTLPHVDGYLTDCGKVFFDRVEKLMVEIGPLEESILLNRKQRDKRMQAERKNRDRREQRRKSDTELPFVRPGSNFQRSGNVDNDNESAAEQLRMLLGGSGERPRSSSTSMDTSDDQTTAKQKIKNKMKELEEETIRKREEGPDELNLGAEGWRERYYKSKFSVNLGEKDFFEDMTQKYAEGLQWVLYYYYQGCASWKWYFPYHYAPFAQEISRVASHKVDFEANSSPFTPFQQLLSVLPSASAKFLPQAYSLLMTDPNSPISDFYPEDFHIDMEGKKFSWQGVAILPFIDESRLFEAIQGLDSTFTPEEKERNDLGYNVIFCHRSHPLAKLVRKAGVANTRQAIDPSTSQLFGYVSTDQQQALFPPGQLPAPVRGFAALFNHQVMSAKFDLPELPPHQGKYTFPAVLRPGLVMPTPVLTPNDFRKQRGFQISGAGNRMAQRSGAHPHFRPPYPMRDHPYGRNDDDGYDHRGDYNRRGRGGYNNRGYDRGGYHDRGGHDRGYGFDQGGSGYGRGGHHDRGYDRHDHRGGGRGGNRGGGGGNRGGGGDGNRGGGGGNRGRGGNRGGYRGGGSYRGGGYGGYDDRDNRFDGDGRAGFNGGGGGGDNTFYDNDGGYAPPVNTPMVPNPNVGAFGTGFSFNNGSPQPLSVLPPQLASLGIGLPGGLVPAPGYGGPLPMAGLAAQHGGGVPLGYGGYPGGHATGGNYGEHGGHRGGHRGQSRAREGDHDDGRAAKRHRY